MTTHRAEMPERAVERAALVSLVTRATRHTNPDVVLDELAGLARAAGAEVVLRTTQDRDAPDAATLIGHGKVERLSLACDEVGATIVIFDNALTPAQARNLEQRCGRRVVDRTELILDIFAQRARTREGKLQVELAQLEYLLPRLAGSGAALSRLGGGIGTRGPGETKLETDRRRIRHRVAALRREIEQVRRRRRYGRSRRRRNETPMVALVGYTNAGKTTLFNLLTGAEARASHALFVTLDPLVRRLKTPGAPAIMLSDTVGFIDRLPHQLVAAFHATLEEVTGADLLVHVIDASAPDRQRRTDAVRTVLAEVGAEAVPIIDVFNKTDLLRPADLDRLRAGCPDGVFLSARAGTGREALLGAMADHLALRGELVRFELDGRRVEDRRLVAELYRVGRVVSHRTEDDRMSIEAELPRRLVGRFTRSRVPA